MRTSLCVCESPDQVDRCRRGLAAGTRSVRSAFASTRSGWTAEMKGVRKRHSNRAGRLTLGSGVIDDEWRGWPSALSCRTSTISDRTHRRARTLRHPGDLRLPAVRGAPLQSQLRHWMSASWIGSEALQCTFPIRLSRQMPEAFLPSPRLLARGRHRLAARHPYR